MRDRCRCECFTAIFKVATTARTVVSISALGAAGLCLIKTAAMSLAADLVIATGALACF